MKVKNQIFKIQNQSATEADIFIYDSIGENFDWWTWAVTGVTYDSFSKELEAVKNMERINIRINSEGGDVHAGLSIYNLLKRTAHNNIHIYVDGVAYSMAAIILMAVPKENRHMAQASMLMFHNASTYISGDMNATKMRELADVLAKYDSILASALEADLGMTNEEVVAKYFDGKDHFLTPQEALDVSLINDIVDSKMEVFNSFKNEENKKSLIEILTSMEDRMVERINNFFNHKNQPPKDMDITDVINELRGGAITDERRTELSNTLEKFNSNKFSQEDIDNAVTTAVSAKSTELADLQGQLKAEQDAKAAAEARISDLEKSLQIQNAGNPPAGADDTPPVVEVENNNIFKMKSLSQLNKLKQ